MGPLDPIALAAVKEERERARYYRSLAATVYQFDASGKVLGLKAYAGEPHAEGIEIGWVAGFLEGEGSFTRTESGGPRISAPQVQREPLERLSAKFGGKITLRVPKNQNAQPIYVWTLSGRQARNVMKRLLPLMSPRRQTQINAVLGFNPGAASVTARNEDDDD